MVPKELLWGPVFFDIFINLWEAPTWTTMGTWRYIKVIIGVKMQSENSKMKLSTEEKKKQATVMESTEGNILEHIQWDGNNLKA